MRARVSRIGRLRCGLACALALVAVSCQTTKIVNFPAPAEPCLAEADIELLATLLGETHPTLERAIYSWSYCIEGEGTVEELESGQVHEVKAGTLYAMNKHDRHRIRATTRMRVICTFVPPLTGDEVHDADGSL